MDIACKLSKHYALSYANQWFVTDKQFMTNLSKNDVIDPVVLRQLAVKYMVARNFNKNEDADDNRWIEAAKYVKEYSAKKEENISNVVVTGGLPRDWLLNLD